MYLMRGFGLSAGLLGRVPSSSFSLASIRCVSCSQTRWSGTQEQPSNRDEDSVLSSLSEFAGDEAEDGRRWRKDVWKLRRQRFTAHVTNLIRKAKLEEAEEVFAQMLARKVRPDAAVFNSLMAGYGRKGDIRTAFKLFNNMKKRAITPTDHSYTSLFNACSKAGPHSLNYLNKIREEIERRNVVLNTIPSNALISALVSCGMPEEAFEVYSDMLKAQLEPQVQTFCSLLAAASADLVTGLEKAQRVWREMVACGIVPDLPCYLVLLQCLRHAGVPQGMREMAEKEWGEKEVVVEVRRKEEGGGVESVYKDDVLVKPRSQVPFVLSSNRQLTLYLGGGRRKWGKWNGKEVRWIEKADVDWLLGEVKGVEVRLFNVLASLLLDPGYLLSEMERRKVEPDGPLMVAAIRTQAHLGNLQGAKSLHSLAEDMGLALGQTGYQAIASGCARLSEGKLLADMRAAGLIPNEYVYGTLLGNAARSRNYEYLTHVLKEMKKDEVLPNQYITDVLEGVAKQKPPGRGQLKWFNGFKGYYELWKRTMSPD